MARIKKTKNIILTRKRKVFRRKLWNFFKFVLISIFFIGAIWGLNYFYNSEYFKVKDIDIQDNKHYTEEEIISLIPKVAGTNIFDINKKRVEETISGELDWVREAELSKIFPDKVVIKLVERKPDFKIVCRDEYFLVDSEGVVLDRIEEQNLNNYEDLILVKNVVAHGVNIGEKIAKKNALSCADIYRTLDSQIKSIIKEARIENNITGDIIFETYNGEEIIFGNGNEIIEKIEILKQLLKEYTDYTIIDLRSTENPVVK